MPTALLWVKGPLSAVSVPPAAPRVYEHSIEVERDLHHVIGMVGTVTLVPIFFVLSQEKATSQFAFDMLDQFLAIFMAVSWNASTAKVLPDALWVHFMHFGVVYFLVSAGLWQLKSKPRKLHTFCAVSAHYVSFAAIRAGDSAQRTLFAGAALGAVACCLVFVLATMAMWVLKHRLGRWVLDSQRVLAGARILQPGMRAAIACRQEPFSAKVGVGPNSASQLAADAVAAQQQRQWAHAWHEANDDLHWDVAAMSVAYLGTQAVHAVAYGEIGCLEEGEGFVDTSGQAAFILTYAVTLTLFWYLIPIQPETEEEEDGDVTPEWWKHNLLHLARLSFLMGAAWGYLSFFKFVISKVIFLGFHSLFLSMVLAMSISVLAILFVVVLSLAAVRRQWKGEFKRVLRLVSLVLAWSWEHAFDATFNAGSLEPHFRFCIAVGTTGLLVPIYCIYLRPLIDRFEE